MFLPQFALRLLLPEIGHPLASRSERFAQWTPEHLFRYWSSCGFKWQKSKRRGCDGKYGNTGFFKKTQQPNNLNSSENSWTPLVPQLKRCVKAVLGEALKNENRHSCFVYWEGRVSNIFTGAPGASDECWNFLVDDFFEPGFMADMTTTILWGYKGNTI